MAVDSAFECTFEVNYRRRTDTGAIDDRNNSIYSLSDPTPIKVWAWYIGVYESPLSGHVDRVDYDATCHAPTELEISVGDLIELPGRGWFKVTRWSEYDHNPLWSPGLADVKLNKVAG
ncbi:hypothetical protein XU06_22925 [Rhodococcus erythropolis]|uniref:hypothetical protein n=1 Tax=Rhodococcus erythropolis TaxID=1833 RepID=UPI00061B7922|nr:hypothetical protein [Rhodococcus erythropolis]AKD99207.1 hypothetical protein XU06_22925 [Rhodococcus erythropolis]